MSDNDIQRRNTIANLMAEWGLVKLVDADKTKDNVAPLSQIKILPFKDKSQWQLVSKYTIGKKKKEGEFVITVNVYRLRDDLEVPTYGTSMANCFDLSFQPTEDHVTGYDKYNNPISQKVNNFGEISIYPGDRLLIPTGLIFKIERLVTI
jgi:hypothetical protein